MFSTLKSLEGGNVTFSAREKMFAAHSQSMDRLVKAGEKQHLQTIAMSVGTSIHQDQSIVHLAVSPVMEKVCLFASTVIETY
jgi:hypothetical protein